MTVSFRRCAESLLLLLSLVMITVAKTPATKNYLLFVGTYTEKESKGIYAYRFDSVSAELTSLGLAAQTVNPSFLVIDPSRRFLYAVNEMQKYKNVDSGAVSAFAIARKINARQTGAGRASARLKEDRQTGNAPTGNLSLINQVSSRGADPCYIAFDKTGKYLLVANYTGGSVAAFPVQADGRVGDSSAFVQHAGVGVDRKRQEGPHAHWIETTPDNRFAIAVDLGLDKLLVYRFDAKTGSLTANDPPYAKLDGGAGPRHLAFHPNGNLAYVLNELQSSITEFAYDQRSGELHKRGTVSTLPAGFSGSSTAAEIKVHPNGKFLYASNRGDDSIAVFSIDNQTGALTLVAHVPTQGKTPRDFEIDPTGNFLLVANQDSGNIVVFRMDRNTGILIPTGQILHVPAPVCLKFMAGGAV